MRIDHPRFEAKAVQRAYAALQAKGARARIVGGAPRNALLGRPITDIDFAVTTPPNETIALAKAAGFKTVPTGIAHGTVLLIDRAGGESFEVTTLREDIETDGRHAVVRFGTDWTADAARRDFTMNALYRDADGTLFDPLGGFGDAKAERVRFIGDARQRILEDGLRILRFFRFSADYGAGRFDDDGLAACAALADRLRDLSGERVRDELLKTLSARHATAALDALAGSGAIGKLLPSDVRLDRFACLSAFETPDRRTEEPVLRLASLLPSEEDAQAAADRLRLSKKDAERLVSAVAKGQRLADEGPGDLSLRLYRWAPDPLLDGLSLAAAISGDADRWREAYAMASRLACPVFPLQGRDVIAAGILPGPRVGQVLAAIEARWIAEGFPERDRVLVLLAEASGG